MENSVVLVAPGGVYAAVYLGAVMHTHTPPMQELAGMVQTLLQAHNR